MSRSAIIDYNDTREIFSKLNSLPNQPIRSVKKDTLNEYIDFPQAGGPTVLGSHPIAVREQLIDLLKTCGPSTGLFHEFELKIAREISRHIPGVDMFRMPGSVTEANMASIRAARLATGKKKASK